MGKNNTEIFGEGYVAGYNQALVDKKFMTQEEADKILRGNNDEREKLKAPIETIGMLTL